LEDQLTEALAAALQAHAGLARSLLSEAGLRLGRRTVSFEVRTQHGFVGMKGNRRSTDLQIRALSGDQVVARLWCENKYGAPEGDLQLDDQYRALMAADPPAKSFDC
jgi:hypothetical protein